MITLTLSSGSRIALNPEAISEIQEAATSSMWHGINCYIRTFDGRDFSVLEGFQRVTAMLAESERDEIKRLSRRNKSLTAELDSALRESL